MIFRLAVTGRPVAVEADTEELRRSVAGLFGPLCVPGAAGAVPDLTLHAVGRGYALVPHDGLDDATLYDGLPEALAAVEHAILVRLLAGSRGIAHLHAAGLAAGAGTILAVGPSGAGKSSIALAWSCAGRAVLSDDSVFVDAQGLVTAIPRLLKVDRARAERMGLDPRGTIAHDPEHPEVWIDPARLGGWAFGPAQVVAIAAVRYDGGLDTRVSRLGEAQGLRLLLDHLLEGGLDAGRSLDRLSMVAASAPAFDVRFGDARDAARSLASLGAGRP